MARYGSCEAGGQEGEQSSSIGMKKALMLVAALATACLVAAVVLIYSGHTGQVSLMEGFTAHLDLDKGALRGLEAAAGVRRPAARRGGYDDATPRLPKILAAAEYRGQGEETKSQMLASFDKKQSKNKMAREGMATSDYGEMTDAAGLGV
mmetsp:Transcript_14376/g.28679  ORF Transcript_14376/g.28679 Transcript_14376/m.28679 type:complete len:150 (+) Transcript_14376:22-471(+)|eukprot:CAMPEP_0181314360 /NCGR_PEP_ID=MMETSP1101-20121128/14776_1 /TAXON_ID=46948 /ORGANISM="Rhodomonas abbreviata, Strain Caron Lab Isolate" /LENGTH=149 /DNA_ID=CAMNT_0023421447 /DNA_START=12 /DNA_END=461 /DNA_ORIENTATION=+